MFNRMLSHHGTCSHGGIKGNCLHEHVLGHGGCARGGRKVARCRKTTVTRGGRAMTGCGNCVWDAKGCTAHASGSLTGQ
jgi:hypothetical protein